LTGKTEALLPSRSTLLYREEYVKAILKNEDLVREQISNKNRNIRDYQKKIEKYKNSKDEKLVNQ
jgi:hypothetical protein